MDRAWLVEGRLYLRGGDQASFALKAWESLRSHQLRWEVRRLLEAAAYNATTKYTSCWSVVHDQESLWKSAIAAWGFAADEHYGLSRQALVKREAPCLLTRMTLSRSIG